MNVVLTFTEEVLGVSSANPDVVREFIASKRPKGVDEDELESLPEIEEEMQRSMTVFPRFADGRPFVWDYQIKGFFKDACSSLRRIKEVKRNKEIIQNGTLSSKLMAHKKLIDGLLFVYPRKVPLVMPAGSSIGICERPIRCQTARGERIALARSETVPAETRMHFQIRLMDAKLEAVLLEWLGYGRYRGMGQWRNSGKGTFLFRAKDLVFGDGSAGNAEE